MLLLIVGFNLLDPACVWQRNFTGFMPPTVAHSSKGIVRLPSGNRARKNFHVPMDFELALLINCLQPVRLVSHSHAVPFITQHLQLVCSQAGRTHYFHLFEWIFDALFKGFIHNE